ncbi:MAG: GIY-YIG nuclease family protein [Proteobacteria bacterium]|nr:GIY-YIG nuclease family protein [Pseudomonadota bacterium]
MAACADDGAVGEEPADADTGAAAAAKPWAVYLLHCAGGKSYIGISPTPDERFEVHRTGKGAAFTRANRPHALAAVVWFESRSAAASMEVRLKSLARPAKLAWFERFAAATATVPATLDVGLASLTSRRLCSST